MSEYTLKREIYTENAWVQIPYGGYSNNVVALPVTGIGYFARVYNPVDIRLRFINLPIWGAQVPGGLARMAIYSVDGQQKLLDTGTLDCNIPNGSRVVEVKLDYWSGFYWYFQATNNAACRGLGLSFGTAYNDPALNSG